MSMSLEERRAERRRRRQMEEEGTSSLKSADELHADVQERLARRRKEREERMANIASSVATVNGEDDFERKRRERREARLRASGDTDYSSTNDYSDYSSRRNRRRGTEEDLEDTSTTSTYSSYRSRRHRNWDDEETPVVNEEPISSVPDTSEEDAAEERRRRQRQEEEEEESRRQAEREAEEERERQAALEEERQREEQERQREEQERQREEEHRLEEERLRQEEEERQRQGNDADDESGSERSLDDDRYKLQRSENKLFINEDRFNGKKDTDNEKKVNVSSKLDINIVQSEPKVSDRIIKFGFSVNNERNYEKSLSLDRSASLEVNNNKIKDKLHKFEHLKDESDSVTKTKDKGLIIPIVEKDGFKGKLKKFETEIREQETTSTDRSTGQNTKSVMLTPQTPKLSEKLQHFEMAAKSQSASRPTSRNIQYELQKIGSTQNQRKALLGRWSASETHINKPDVRDMPKRNVLDRWKSVEKSPQEPVTMRTPTQKKEVLTKRLSGNTEFIASKYLEKASKSIDEPSTPSPKTPTSATQKLSFSQSFDHRLSSPPTETQSEYSTENGNQSRPKVTSRWIKDDGNVTTPYSTTPSRHYSGSSVERNGKDSSFDDSAHSRGSSIDESSGLARKLSCQQQEEEEEAERERLRQEEEEKTARMAAEEGQKKRGKRKGLGGLTPEKKKKLKQIIMQKAAEDLKKEALAKAQEKEKFINDRVGPFNTEGLGEAELRKLIKGLHEKLAQLHSESYDVEFKLNKQEKELIDLNMKISDSRGKFAKPVLRKVNKTEQKFAALAKKQEAKDDFRETLKSVQDDDEPAE